MVVRAGGLGRRVWARNERIAVQALLGNLRRLGWLAALLVPLSLLHVTASWVVDTPAPWLAERHAVATAATAAAASAAAEVAGPSTGAAAATAAGWADATVASRWAEMVVALHLGLAADLALVAGLIAWARRMQPRNRTLQGALELWGLVSVLGFTIVVAGVDPWLSAHLTPFLVGCVLVGALFLQRPQRAVPLYLAAFASYAVVLGLTLPDDGQLLYYRVDGLIAAALGLLVSQMIWRKHVLQETLVVELQASRQDLQACSAELQALAVRDELTGLWNRAEFMRLTQRELTRAQRHGGETCFVAVELDHFQQVVDRWGVAIGERALVAVATLLREELRATDEVARLGTESFALLLPQTGLDEARQLAERLHQAVGRLRLPVGDATVRVSAHLGLSVQAGRALVPVPQQCERLHLAAERALIRARRDGEHPVAVAPTMPPD